MPRTVTKRDWAERMPRETERRLSRRHPGRLISTDRIAEQPVPALLVAAEDADILVLGSRGASAVTGFLVGSVALAVLARTAQRR